MFRRLTLLGALITFPVPFVPSTPPRPLKVLLVVGEGPYREADQRLWWQLTSRGYQATVAQDQGGRQPHAGDADVVVLSPSASPAGAARFRAVKTPIVALEARSFPRLGLSVDRAGEDFGRWTEPKPVVLMFEGTHPLAAGVDGERVITSGATEMGWAIPTAEATIVARSAAHSERAVLFAYEAGAFLVSGPAPARRVGFGLSEASLSALTPEGWRILFRSLEWAAGRAMEGSEDAGPVTNPSSPGDAASTPPPPSATQDEKAKRPGPAPLVLGSPSVAAGGTHSLALSVNNAVSAWGAGSLGQLGQGNNNPSLVPLAVSGVSGIVAIAAGTNHTVALKDNGSVWVWGSDSEGQLGDGSPATNRNNPFQLTGLPTITAIAAGGNHTLVLTSTGTLYSWGSNSSGQLGNGSGGSGQRSYVPVQVVNSSGTPISGITAIAAGASHSLAVKSDGTALAWGLNTSGQLGDDSQISRFNPVPVSGLTGVSAISGGDTHSLALKTGGFVAAWGANGSGQLGTGNNNPSQVPVTVPLLGGVAGVAAGGTHSLVRKTDGSLAAWGLNNWGQIGDGTSGNTRLSPVSISGPSGVAAISTRANHSLAVTQDGVIWAWGTNAQGQIGDGTAVMRKSPVAISEAGLAWKVATPTFSNYGGNSPTPVNVTIATVTAGAALHYTTTGADPTTGDLPVPGNGIVVVDAGMTLKARAFKLGMPPSNVTAGVFTFFAPAPTANPAEGVHYVAPSVTLSTTLSGSTIRYTTDGTEPTGTSFPYSSPIPVNGTLTIKAKTFRTGWTASATASFTYTLKVGPPTFAPPAGSYPGSQTVTVSTVTPGAVLHYTTDGGEPTESDPVVASGGTVAIAQSKALKVRGWKSGLWTPSDTTSGNYTISFGTAAAPTFEPAAGTYTAGQLVTLKTTTPQAAIRFTTDGSEPKLTSKVYLGPLLIAGTTTVKAKAFRADWTPSSTSTAAYVINLTNTVAMPAFSVPGGTYTVAQTVVLTTATSGATIHYTTDGTEPTTSDLSVASGGSVTVDRYLSLRAKAFKSGMNGSPTRRVDYAITGAVVIGYGHALALKVDGTLWGWGTNGAGQIGNNSTTTVTAPVQVLEGVRGMAATSGQDHQGFSLAVKSNGTIWGMGRNNYGQLGETTTNTPKLTPVQTAGLTGKVMVAVASGANHSLGLSSDGTVFSWGQNSLGQLGSGSTGPPRTTPAAVAGLTGVVVVAIAAGENHSLALTADGSVVAWGRNNEGQLGDGTFDPRYSPTPVLHVKGAVAISAGGNHSLALGTEGGAGTEVWSWGYNGYGQLGDDTGQNRSVPAKVLSDVLAVHAEAQQSLYLRPHLVNQGIWGTGHHFGSLLAPVSYNYTAPLTSTVPVLIAGGPFSMLAPGRAFSVAVKWDTTLIQWSNVSYPAADGFTLGYGTGAEDPDQDGLATAREWMLGSDPWAFDTNGDGLGDGQALAIGRSATSFDLDGDGVLNATEIARGTDPFLADTDGDGVGDQADCFPLDPTRNSCPPTSGDTTPPIITLTEPTNATPVPPQ